MAVALAFWILMLLWVVLGFWHNYPNWPNPLTVSFNLLLFVLIVMLGWHAFGPPLRASWNTFGVLVYYG